MRSTESNHAHKYTKQKPKADAFWSIYFSSRYSVSFHILIFIFIFRNNREHFIWPRILCWFFSSFSLLLFKAYSMACLYWTRQKKTHFIIFNIYTCEMMKSYENILNRWNFFIFFFCFRWPMLKTYSCARWMVRLYIHT